MSEERTALGDLLASRWVTHGIWNTYWALKDFVTAGNDQPSFRMIAWWGRVTKPSVWRALKILREHGYVSWTRCGARNRYELPLESQPDPELRALIGQLFHGVELWRGPAS